MRNLFSFAALIIVAVCVTRGQAQTVRYGYVTDLGGTAINVPGWLLGIRIDVPQPMTLTAAGTIFRTDGTLGQDSVYTDNNGAAGSLIANTAVFQINNTGVVEIPYETPTTIAAGYYWFMADYNQDTSTGFGSNPSQVGEYDPFMTLGNPLPANFQTFFTTDFSGQAINYYFVGTVPEPACVMLLCIAAATQLRPCRKRRRMEAANVTSTFSVSRRFE
jgi:hypothetical protein